MGVFVEFWEGITQVFPSGSGQYIFGPEVHLKNPSQISAKRFTKGMNISKVYHPDFHKSWNLLMYHPILT